MFKLIDAHMPDKLQAAILKLYGLSSPFMLIDEQPFISKRQRDKVGGIHHRTLEALARRNLIEYDVRGGVRLTVNACRLVARV